MLHKGSASPLLHQAKFSWKGDIMRIILRNLLGQEVSNNIINIGEADYSINTRGIEPGIYMIEVYFKDGHNENEKIILE
jgi:hypothetical protein